MLENGWFDNNYYVLKWLVSSKAQRVPEIGARKEKIACTDKVAQIVDRAVQIV
jgi:hypothetical protein